MKRLLYRKGQGMTEYVVILGVILTIALGIFLTKLQPALQDKVAKIAADIK